MSRSQWLVEADSRNCGLARPGPVAITIEFRESGGRLATYILEIAEDSCRVVIRTTSHIAKEAMTACLNNWASRTSWRWQRFG